MATESRDVRPEYYKYTGDVSYRKYSGTGLVSGEGTVFRFDLGSDVNRFTLSSLKIHARVYISRATSLDGYVFTSEPNESHSNYAYNGTFQFSANTEGNLSFTVSSLGTVSGNCIWVYFGISSGVTSVEVSPNSSKCVAAVEYTPEPDVITLISPANGSSFDASDSILFEWSDSSLFLKIYTLQYSADGETWTDFGRTEFGEYTFQVDASIFPKGAARWRVNGSSPGTFSVNYPQPYLLPVNSPTSGNVNRSSANDFSIKLRTNGSLFAPFGITTATLYWRAGSSGAYTAVAMTPDADTATVTIGGGTFPSGTIQWYAQAVDNTGTRNDTEVYTILAVNAEAEAEPISPINTIEATSNEIVFAWRYYTLDGSPQSRAVLEYSMDAENWGTIADVLGSATTHTAPAGFFNTPGTIYWRVQAFNVSGTAGPVSEAVSFLLFGAPSVTSVIGDGKPFATVQWQAEGQVSYELMIGDKHIGPYFGADVRRYTIIEPLEDGIYTIKVRIQNRFDIWSEWAETEMSVQNAPGAGILIQQEENNSASEASIKILYGSATGYYYMIYRDGKYIGKTTEAYFNDRAAIGAHTYQVDQALPDGYVARSNELAIETWPKSLLIAPLAGGEFIELRLSVDADRAQNIQRSREVVYVHYSGSRYPSSEIGEAETMSVTFDTAWKQTDKETADAFEALVGEDVIFKTPDGYVIVGTLRGYDLHDPHFYKSYRCTLQQGDWRDFVNVT